MLLRHVDRRRRLLVGGIAGAAVLVLLVAWGVYGLLLGPAYQPTDAQQSTISGRPSPNVVAQGPRPIPPAEDPEIFARRVAVALFTWDTRAAADVSEWAQVTVDVADVDEAAATASDVRSYLPSVAFWQRLRGFGTRQWLVVESIVVPEGWQAARQQAGPGQLPRGATAFTITGTRHRDGVWGTEPVHSTRPVAFTVFIACEPSQTCRLLRLSTLDNPLR